LVLATIDFVPGESVQVASPRKSSGISLEENCQGPAKAIWRDAAQYQANRPDSAIAPYFAMFAVLMMGTNLLPA